MSDELIKRLNGPSCGNVLLCREAASRIESQQREIEELRAALRDLWKYAAVPYQRSFLGKHPEHRALLESIVEGEK